MLPYRPFSDVITAYLADPPGCGRSEPKRTCAGGLHGELLLDRRGEAQKRNTGASGSCGGGNPFRVLSPTIELL